MANRIFLCGDIHGDASPIFDFANRVKLDETDYIIFLGDFGANYWLDHRDDKFKQQMEEILDIRLFCAATMKLDHPS